MYLMRVALIAVATFSLASCQDDGRRAPLSANVSESAASLVPRDCIPCGNQMETCCSVGQKCAFDDGGGPICVQQRAPVLNTSTASTAVHSVPEIARDTFQTTTIADSTADAPTFITSLVIPSTTESTAAPTEVSIARTAATTYAACSVWDGDGYRCEDVCCGANEDCSFPGTCTPVSEGATATYALTGNGPLQPLETIKMEHGQNYENEGVDLTYWCADQMSTCPLLCGGEPAANECYTPEEIEVYDPNEIEITCVCADGSVPARSTHIHTIEDHICEQDRDDCINELLSSANFSQRDQDACFERSCGVAEIRVAPFNTTTPLDTTHSKPNTLITAQSTTINVPYIGLDLSSYGASVVAVDNTATTIRIQCYYDSLDADCGEAMPTMTLTVGPLAYDLYRADGTSLAVSQGCSWPSESWTAPGGNCVGSTVALAASTTTPELSVSTFAYPDGSDGGSAPLTITAGAYKLQNALATGSGLGGDGTAVGVVSSNGGGTSVMVDGSDTKKNAGVGVEVGVSAALVTVMLMLVLIL